MKSQTLLLLIFFQSSILMAQERELVSNVDRITQQWDQEAKSLETYDGMREYCKNRTKRVALISLVKEIHHYDSVLYKTVKAKYDQNKDEEAAATLKDIKKLEDEYTTAGFLKFIHTECSAFNTIENNYGQAKGKPYEKEKAKMEKNLVKYVEEITQQIDVIDEHIHHLKEL